MACTVWAQKDPLPKANLVHRQERNDPWTLGSEPGHADQAGVRLGMHSTLVNEGPAFLFHENKIYITCIPPPAIEMYAGGC